MVDCRQSIIIESNAGAFVYCNVGNNLQLILNEKLYVFPQDKSFENV